MRKRTGATTLRTLTETKTKMREITSWRTYFILPRVVFAYSEQKDSDPKGAIEQYMLLLDSEEPMTEKAWSAKCINEIINIKIKKNDLSDMNQVVKKLLTYINSMSKYDRGVTIDCIFNAVNKINDVPKKREVYIRDLTNRPLNFSSAS